MPCFRECRAVRSVLLLLVVACLACHVGCGRRTTLVPVSGCVTLDGRPLEFGSVMIQPSAGPAARGTIRADGSFTVGTFAPGDGAIVGPATVRVACYELQRPGAPAPPGEPSLGRSLIPEKYTGFETSGITVTVAKGMAPLEIALTSK